MEPQTTNWILPREHGAWGILLVPFLTAAAIADRFSPAVPVGLATVLLAFLARSPLELLFVPHARGRPPGLRRKSVRWQAAICSLAAAGAASLLVTVWGFYWILPLAVVALMVFGLRLRSVWRGTDRSWLSELAATAGLTLSALVGWVASTGRVDQTGILVWLLNWVFFSSGMLYVKSRIRAQMAQHHPEVGDPRGFMVAFHLAVMVFVLALVSFRWASPLVVVPFAVAALRANWGFSQAGQGLPLRRLGWSEVALSLLFAGFLTLGFRL